MSSSNLVRVALIEETTYGETPPSGNFSTARFTSESLSGSPVTVESQQLRTDRMSSGQIVAGLDVKGPINIELAKEDVIDALMESAMYNTWGTLPLVTVDLDYNALTGELTRSSGDWSGSGVAIVVGDILTLAGFSASANNTQVMVTSVDSAAVIKIVGPPTLSSETGSGTSYKRADKLTIGTTKKSFSMEKKFTDLTTKGINYKGMIASTMDLNFAFGALVTGAFGFMGNGQSVASQASDLITNSRTVNAPATSNTLNGSVDMPFIASDIYGNFGALDFWARSLSIKLDNSLLAQSCIGAIAPRDYSAGTCKLNIDLSSYLKDVNWDTLSTRLSQTAIKIGFMVKNTDGWYGVYLPAVQLSFDDPASGGANQDVVLGMKGLAKVGSSGESAIVFYRS